MTTDLIRIPDTPLVEGDRAKLTISIARLRNASACHPRFAHLLNGLGLASIDTDDDSGLSRALAASLSALSEEQLSAPINLLRILDLNGVEDCLWALCATEQNCERQARLIAADCAEMVLHLFEAHRLGDQRPREAIFATRAFARAAADAAADAARAAAYAARAAADAAAYAADAARAAAYAAYAARAAADAAAYAADAARAAAYAAACAAAYAARAAAYAAARAAARAAADAAQEQILRRYLIADKEAA